MKNIRLPLLVLVVALATACSSDNPNSLGNLADPVDIPTSVVSVVLNEVEYLGDRVEIFNEGTTVVDLSGYFLCLGPGTYSQIGTLDVRGDLNIQPGQYVVVTYDMATDAGGLGLYFNDSDFSDATTMADFVQWGATGSPREGVAIEAGLWPVGDFVPVSGDSDNSLVYDGEGETAGDWSESTTTTFGQENVPTAPQ